jgi:hypothetical protein
MLARWLGHSEERAICATCRSGRVRYLIVDGGLGAAWNLLETEIASW